MLERFHCALTWLRLEATVLGHINNFSNFLLIKFDLSAYFLHNSWFSNDISHANCKTSVYEPVVDYKLDI